MTNKEIANVFNELAKIMELHGENPFKIRSYQNAYLNLRKLQSPLSEMPEAEIASMKGVGKAISAKIQELLTTGQLETLNKYLDKTPEGVRDMLKIKGFGPKKIKLLWDQLEVESVGELLYACNENRLVELKGFGAKTQEDLRQKLQYFLQSKGKYHYAHLERIALEVLEVLKKRLPAAKLEFCGQLRRRNTIADTIEILCTGEAVSEQTFDQEQLKLESRQGNTWIARLESGIPVHLHTCDPAEYGSKLFRYTATDDFLQGFIKETAGMDFKGLESEEAIFSKANIAFIAPELRETAAIIDKARAADLPALVTPEEIKGVIHSHTTYSDGIHTLAEMVAAAQEKGYDYIGITDHSKSAFYANGLKEDRVLQQMAEIDAMNQQLDGFRIFKGIESDILNDGSLDYEEELLKQFDFIIASVHSNLRMEEAKATNRLIQAIENPYTTMLGHPTGRLLLSRKGYPIDHQKIIDACAANQVCIELNANPYRLDLDWTWIPYAMEKGVLISVNPDAHSRGGIDDIRYGVYAARKGGLTPEGCLNCRSIEAFEEYIRKK